MERRSACLFIVVLSWMAKWDGSKRAAKFNGSGFRRHRAHVEKFPAVTIGIGEAVLIHEAVVPGLGIRGATGSDSFRDQILDLLTAIATQAVQHFQGFPGVADGLRCELQELGFGEHHDMDLLADDDASPRIIAELRVVREAEHLEERERSREVRDGEIDENLGAHGVNGSR